ncbi:MAG: COG2426 family protein [Acidimicrobiia bacterium]
MREQIVAWVESVLPPQLAVMFLAMLPIFELRLALPVAREIFAMGPLEAYAWSVIGNLVPIPFILALLGPVTDWAEHHWAGLHRFLDRLKKRTRTRGEARFERLRDLAVITFVAIPLPFTGAWTGALASHVFGVEHKKAFGLITIGVLISGLIVTVLLEAFDIVI